MCPGVPARAMKPQSATFGAIDGAHTACECAVIDLLVLDRLVHVYIFIILFTQNNT